MRILTFDVGGTFIKYAIMNEQAELQEKGKVKTPQESQEAFFEALEEVVNKYLPLDGIALSLPGVMDAERGYIHVGGALQYNNECDMKALLEKRFSLPVSIENDARCAALAEVWKGNLQGVEDAAVMILGTGVGGALIKGGRIHRGKNFFSGEFSYILGSDCREQGFASSFAARASAVGFVEKVRRMKQIEDCEFDGVAVFDLIHQGDAIACECFNEFAWSIAHQAYNIQAIFDPEKICIGGGISQQAILVEEIKKQLEAIYASLPLPMPHCVIDVCKFHNDSNLIGACYQYLLRTGNL